uniref:ATPase H+ transporting accessory protein 1b n=1 Tax=Tetraodon nigroviridis TaxID=99883 RepID=H3D4H8_TETNG
SERFIILKVLLFSCLVTVSFTAQVPVLIWSTESKARSLPPLPPLAAGHITSMEELGAYFSSAFGSDPHTVLLFLQAKLSKEDFAVFGGVYGNKEDSAFKNLEAGLQTSSSSVSLPAVEWLGSSGVPALLQEKLGVSPVLLDADTLAHLSIDKTVSKLLLINLPYCSDSTKLMSSADMDSLLSADGIIGNVLSTMKAKNIPYVAIYTGLQPSRVIPEISVSGEHIGRSLLQTADVKPPIMFNVSGAPCIMLWAEKLNVAFSASGPWMDLATQTPSLAGSACNSTNSQLVLNYPLGITLRFVMSQRFYPASARNWFTLEFVELRSNSTTATFSGSRFIYAPAEYSYHCQSVPGSVKDDAMLVLSSTNQSTSAWRLDFVDFQIQGFGLANGTDFSYASDCAGFFTAGIWMGLLTSLILLLIFIYGLHMIMHLNTMDRFDDPKGPSISVPQTE